MLGSKQTRRKLYSSAGLGLLILSFLIVPLNIHFVSGTGSWWNADWTYRKEMTINHTMVSADMTNFPILIDVTDSDLMNKAQSDGHDIAFTDYSGNKLNHEIESYDSSTGHLVAWVSAAVSSTQDTILYMYYGNPSASNQQNPTAAWDSNYIMVQHLKETFGVSYDSTVNHNNATPHGNVDQGVSGKIDGADNFAGTTSDYLSVGNMGATDDWTVSFWVNSDNINGVVFYPIGLGVKPGTSEGVGISVGGTHSTIANDFNLYDGSTNIHGGPTVQVSVWYYVTVVKSSTTYTIYINGVSQVTGNLSAIDITNLTIGERSDGILPFAGTIDEVRVSNAARSATSILTEYDSQNSPSSFCAIGAEERNTDLTVTGISIDNHGCSIYANDTYVNGSICYYPVEVTLSNIGSIDAGSFHVKLEAYAYNGSFFEASQEIVVPSLAAGASTIVNFTSLFHPTKTGLYRLNATANSQNEITEYNETNDVLVMNNVPVTAMGDVNGDGHVNLLDAVIVSLAWDSTSASPQWDIRADVNHDGAVDVYDAIRLGLCWGEIA
jgi:hypothetical protein